MVCRESYEDLTDMCAPDLANEALNCRDTGHLSDYCICDRGTTAGDAGTADAGPSDAAIDATDDSGMPCASERPWECILSQRVGFGREASGGAGGALCWVENLNSTGAGSLAACLDAPGPRWIVFRVSGTIRTHIDVPANTTIDGRGQQITLEGVRDTHLVNIGASNVILTHLTLTNRAGGSTDVLHTEASADNVWLDHLSLSDTGDELMGLEGGNTTISWCHLRDAGYAILAGGQSRAYPDLWITAHHNAFTGNSERHPYTRAQFHSFNNYIQYDFSGARVSDGGHILSEGNLYEATVARAALRSRPGGAITVAGHFRSTGDVTRGMAMIDHGGNDPTPVFDARDSYDYEVETADDALEARVRTGAGWQDVPLPMP